MPLLCNQHILRLLPLLGLLDLLRGMLYVSLRIGVGRGSLFGGMMLYDPSALVHLNDRNERRVGTWPGRYGCVHAGVSIQVQIPTDRNVRVKATLSGVGIWR